MMDIIIPPLPRHLITKETHSLAPNCGHDEKTVLGIIFPADDFSWKDYASCLRRINAVFRDNLLGNFPTWFSAWLYLVGPINYSLCRGGLQNKLCRFRRLFIAFWARNRFVEFPVLFQGVNIFLWISGLFYIAFDSVRLLSQEITMTEINLERSEKKRNKRNMTILVLFECFRFFVIVLPAE